MFWMVLFGILINPWRFSSQFACSVVFMPALVSDHCENSLALTKISMASYQTDLSMVVILTVGRLKQMFNKSWDGMC